MLSDGEAMARVPQARRVLGIPIHPVVPQQLIEILLAWGDEPGRSTPRRIYNVNVRAMNIAARNESFRSALEQADLVYCDGHGVRWGAWILGTPLPARMTPPDWIDAFAAATASRGQSVFALGDEGEIASRFQRSLAEEHPGYRAAGGHHGFFEKTGPENDRIIDRINRSNARHLLVGFGMPRQELWLEENLARLQVGTVIPVGALFRYYTAIEQRGPRWLTDRGFEWATRLARRPIHHFRRYVIGNPLFLARAVLSRFFGAAERAERPEPDPPVSAAPVARSRSDPPGATR
jgi:N-acetylglucosaminyldiphosphoundecaprenol N-acetyl-beta-D-mannosaminyltransferase